jgi:Zn-finger nucleic acid-binding protein
MLSPKCPNCQEHMSIAELGLDGVWSCVYCEGAWLSATEVERMLTVASKSEAMRSDTSQSGIAGNELTCPVCETASFVPVSVENQRIHCCSNCRSIFFAKGVLTHLCPTVGNGASGPEIALKAVANVASWVVLSIAPFSTS